MHSETGRGYIIYIQPDQTSHLISSKTDRGHTSNCCKPVLGPRIFFTPPDHAGLLYKENRIDIRVEFTRKECKTAILLYCFHTAGVLHIFMLYNLLGPGISFYRKSKIIVKRKPNHEIGWFHN